MAVNHRLKVNLEPNKVKYRMKRTRKEAKIVEDSISDFSDQDSPSEEVVPKAKKSAAAASKRTKPVRARKAPELFE